MFDFTRKWTPARFDGSDDGAGSEMRIVPGLQLLLLSGNTSSALLELGIQGQGLGATSVASGDAFALAIARDRLLVVASRPTLLDEGWRAGGFALTEATDGISIVEFSGTGLLRLLNMATTVDWEQPTRSAAISFAGLPAAAAFYHGKDRLWLFIETPLLPTLRAWFAIANAS